MRIHSENAQSYLQAIVACISKNPASLENWQCLHVEHTEDAPSHWVESAMGRIKGFYSDVECELVFCPDHDILIISRNQDVDILQSIVADLKNMGDDAWQWGKTTVYDLFQDWHAMHTLLCNKCSDVPLITKPREAPSYYFGEIASLNDIFHEAQKLIKSRLPLHVMIVENDPLTRHLVADCFKEEYALITAVSEKEAITNYALQAPDIVFLDIGMPDASGFTVLRQIMISDPDA